MRVVLGTTLAPSPYHDPKLVASYHELAVRHHFARPAADLVAVLQPSRGSRLLDVGCGTGVASALALQALGPGGTVVSIDPSPEMLRRARKSCACLALTARAPHLPFRDATFDAALAGFSLSHFPDYHEGLLGIARVLRAGATFAASAWRRLDCEPVLTWRRAVERHVDLGAVADGLRRALPWEEWFADEENLRRALLEAGFVDVRVTPREYPVEARIEDFLAMRENSIEGAIIRSLLEPERWPDFQRQTRALFQERFPDGVRYTRPASIASGKNATMRPSSSGCGLSSR